MSATPRTWPICDHSSRPAAAASAASSRRSPSSISVVATLVRATATVQTSSRCAHASRTVWRLRPTASRSRPSASSRLAGEMSTVDRWSGRRSRTMESRLSSTVCARLELARRLEHVDVRGLGDERARTGSPRNSARASAWYRSARRGSLSPKTTMKCNAHSQNCCSGRAGSVARGVQRLHRMLGRTRSSRHARRARPPTCGASRSPSAVRHRACRLEHAHEARFLTLGPTATRAHPLGGDGSTTGSTGRDRSRHSTTISATIASSASGKCPLAMSALLTRARHQAFSRGSRSG